MPDGRRFQPQEQAPSVSEEELGQVIEEGDAEKLNEVTERLGKYYVSGRREGEKLSSSQIRNVLDRIQRMGKYDKNQLQLLRPLLAYAAGRHRGRVQDLQRVLDRAIKKVTDGEKFINFKNFFEAIVAYHRFHGGK